MSAKASRLALLAGASILCFSFFVPAYANTPEPEKKAESPEIDLESPSAFLYVGIGSLYTFDPDSRPELRIEYRHNTPFFWKIAPMGGLELATDGTVFANLGLWADFKLSESSPFHLIPSIAAGYYEDGDEKDLGHRLEFRSQIELAYEFKDQSRLSFGLSHISNASTGNKNPGAEAIILAYHFPLGR